MKTLKTLLFPGIALFLLLSPVMTSATTPSLRRPALAALVAPGIHTDAERIANLEQKLADAKVSADNAWMLMSAALVLLMTGPGLALFYGGLVRKKNVLATMLQSFAMMSLITILWGLVGYSLAFGSGNAFYRRIRVCVPARRGWAAERRLCADDSAPHLHDLPAHVRRDYSGAD